MKDVDDLIKQIRAMDNRIELTADREKIMVNHDIGEVFLTLVKDYIAEVTAYLVRERNESEGEPEKREHFNDLWVQRVASKYD